MLILLSACLATACPTCVNSALDHRGKRRHQSTFSGLRCLRSLELLCGSATSGRGPLSTNETPGLVLYLPFQHHDSNHVVGGRRILIEVRAAHGEPECAKNRSEATELDSARARIVTPEEKTTDRGKKRVGEKFNRQVECRSERDPDEPASAEIDEWHSRADPRLIILAWGKCRAGELRCLSRCACSFHSQHVTQIVTRCHWNKHVRKCRRS
jgi:hypothetical protein